MKFGYLCKDDKHPGFSTFIGDAFAGGVSRFGHSWKNYKKQDMDTAIHESDVLVILSVASASKEIFNRILNEGKRYIYIDKGFHRSPDVNNLLSKTFYYRVSCNAFQPLHYLNDFNFPKDRLKILNLPFKDMQVNPLGRIVFAGSSQKYCNFHGLGDATNYARKIFRKIRKKSSFERELVYRAKPSWKDAVPIEDTTFSNPKCKLKWELQGGAYALITHGSNAAFEALVDGYPVFVLGDGIVKGLGVSSLDDIDRARYPSIKERQNIFKNIAYHQYSIDEFRCGTAWDFLRQNIYKDVYDV